MTQLNGSGYEQFPNASCTGSEASKTIKLITYSVFLFSSLIGNVLVVAVFYRNRTLRTSVHYFIVNMAISDLIFPVIALPDLISYEYHNGLWLVDGVLGTVLCKLAWITWSVSTSVSIFSMITIAADRFHAVMFPLKSVLISRNTCRIILAAIWIASVTFRAHYLYAAKLVTSDMGLKCIMKWEPVLHMREVRKITWILLFCLISLSAIVLTVLYSSIIVFLYREKSNLYLASEVVKSRAKENRKITCMLVIIVVVFYAVWIPYHVRFCIFFLRPNIRVPCTFTWMVELVLPLLYPVINPIVYFKFIKNYRQGFRELLCCQWPCNNRCNGCLQSSVSPQGENNVQNTGQVNTTTENIELQQQ